MSDTKQALKEFRDDIHGLVLEGYEDNPVVQALADATVARFDELIEQARTEGQAAKEDANNNPHGVKVGQVWKDNDRRGGGRRGTVVHIEGTHAGVDWGPNITRVRLTRFKPTATGYRLIVDVKA